MSLEKIKQRIKMIESNNFNINEDNINVIDDTNIALRKGHQAVDAAEKIAADVLGGSYDSFNKRGSGVNANLSDNTIKKIKPVLSLVNKYEITDGLTPSGELKYGYKIYKKDNIYSYHLLNDKMVQIQFTDSDFLKIKSINIRKDGSKLNNIKALVNDVTKNIKQYGVKSIVDKGKYIVIELA